MFDFIGSLFAKTGALVGGFFLSIGVVLGGSPTVQEITPPTQVATETVAPAVEATEPELEAPSPAPKPSTTTPAPAAKTPASKTPVASFQVLDVKSVVGKETAEVTWKTSLPARSRLTVDGKVYESTNGVGTDHRVLILVETSREYNYHIFAKTLDEKGLEDDVYGFFSAEKEYVFSLGEIDEKSCRIIIMKDTAGNFAYNQSLEVRGIDQPSTIITYRPAVTLTTNSKGEVKYCHKATRYEIFSGDDLVTLP